MKIAIISDSHDNLPNLEKFLDWARDNKMDMIIHCGDIAAPTVVKEVLAPGFSGPIHLVHGNVSDRHLLAEVCGELSKVTLHGDVGEVEADGQQLAFCHFPEIARELAQTGKYHLIFYGHTHKPWMETLAGGVQMINPGTLGGMFQKATFAVYDTQSKNLELKVLEKI